MNDLQTINNDSKQNNNELGYDKNKQDYANSDRVDKYK